jgi:hypothetical protein
VDLEDLFKGKHRRERRDDRDEGWMSRGDRHPYGERYSRHHGHAPPIALALLPAVTARPWFLAAAAGVLLVVLVAGIWVSILLLGYIGEHGVKGLLDAVLAIGMRLWEGR